MSQELEAVFLTVTCRAESRIFIISIHTVRSSIAKVLIGQKKIVCKWGVISTWIDMQRPSFGHRKGSNTGHSPAAGKERGGMRSKKGSFTIIITFADTNHPLNPFIFFDWVFKFQLNTFKFPFLCYLSFPQYNTWVEKGNNVGGDLGRKRRS